MPSLIALRASFRRLPVSAAKQIGERAIKDALALADRNPARVAELTAIAVFQLPYAKVAR